MGLEPTFSAVTGRHPLQLDREGVRFYMFFIKNIVIGQNIPKHNVSNIIVINDLFLPPNVVNKTNTIINNTAIVTYIPNKKYIL